MIRHTIVQDKLPEYLTAPLGSVGSETFRASAHEVVLFGDPFEFESESMPVESTASLEESLRFPVMTSAIESSSSLAFFPFDVDVDTSSWGLRASGGSRNCPINEIVDILYREVFSRTGDAGPAANVAWIDDFDELGGQAVK